MGGLVCCDSWGPKELDMKLDDIKYDLVQNFINNISRDK